MNIKKNKKTIDPKENFEITKLKSYQRKNKTFIEEKQTLLKEKKKAPKRK